MPTLKNWRKVRDDYEVQVWRWIGELKVKPYAGSQSRPEVAVEREGDDWRLYYRGKSGFVTRLPELFTNRVDATRAAVNYVRGHPNG